ncbi:MAG: MFS transporter [Gammaproteobacteria bacterium]|nr:MFS transporter [Gammaproteobacteria bacterium]
MNKANFSKFLIIWMGELISTIGSGITAFALGVYAFRLTGLATSVAMVVLFTFLPAFLLRPIGGVLADRANRFILMILGNLGSAFGILLVYLLLADKSNDLIMIYPGIVISSIFVALQNPAFKASVTDLLPPELFAKASGLVQLSGSAQFLIAPLVAGFLMTIMNVRYVLLIDILSFVVSALLVFVVWWTIKEKCKPITRTETHFFAEMSEGFRAIVANRGVLVLVILVSLLLFYIGLIQALLAPMILSFSSTRTLGIAQSVCAIGMLLSAIIISTHVRKGNNVIILCVSLALMGLFFSFIGILPNFWVIVIPGFLFFAALPFVNSSLDVLIRQNISNEKQGRVWSLISVMTNSGAMLAYAISGFLADKIFNPLFMPGGALSTNLGHIFGVGPGRGIAFIFFLSGVFVIILSVFIYKSKSIRKLDLT